MGLAVTLSKRPFVCPVLAFLVGLSAFESRSVSIYALVGALLIVAGLAFWVRHSSFCVLIAAYFLGGAIVAQPRPTTAQPFRPPVGRGYIEGRVERVGVSLKKAVLGSFHFSPHADGPWKRYGGRFLLSGWRSSCGRPGDVVRARVRVRKVRPRLADGLFDQEAYLAAHGAGSYGRLLSGQCVVVDDACTGFDLVRRFAYQQRISLADLISGRLLADKRGLALALILGRRDQISASTKRMISGAGASHLLAVSGLHFSIFLGMACWGARLLFRRSPRLLLRFGLRPLVSWIGLPVGMSFVLLVGHSPSAQRAFLMALIVFVVWLVRGRVDLLNTLSASGFFILAIFPHQRHATSFWLSVIAVFSIWIGTRLASHCFAKSTQSSSWLSWLRASLIVSVSASLGTLALVHSTFQEVSLLSPLSNLVLIPFVTFCLLPTLLLGLGLDCLGLGVSLPVWQLFGFFAEVFFCGVRTFSSFPGAHFHGPLSLVWTVVFLLFLALAFLCRARRAIKFSLCLASVVALTSFLAGLMREVSPRVDFLPVGQGDAILVTGDDKSVLIDTGTKFDGERVVVPYLWSRGISKLDAVIVTHPDSDHLGGLETIRERVLVQEIYYNGDLDSVPKHQRGLFREAGVLRPGNRVFALVEVLGPRSIGQVRRKNDRSLVLKLSFRGSSLLLTGDAERKGEDRLLSLGHESLKATALKLGHHGSRTSSGKSFLTRVNPAFAVVSPGTENRFGFPHKSVLRRLQDARIPLYRTDTDGLVTLFFKESEICVRRFLRSGNVCYRGSSFEAGTR